MDNNYYFMVEELCKLKLFGNFIIYLLIFNKIFWNKKFIIIRVFLNFKLDREIIKII